MIVPGKGFNWQGSGKESCCDGGVLAVIFCSGLSLIETRPQLRCRLIRHLSVSHGRQKYQGDSPLSRGSLWVQVFAKSCSCSLFEMQSAFDNNKHVSYVIYVSRSSMFIYFDAIQAEMPYRPYPAPMFLGWLNTN